MNRWRAICSYDGTDFVGWQSQAGGNAVQDAVERALGRILGQPVRVHAASRTDSGVHARGQGIHFDCDWRHSGGALLRAVHAALPASVRLRAAAPAPAGFHARYSAEGKRYRYFFSTAPADPFTARYRWHLDCPFDPGPVAAALPALGGRHDFRAFAGKVADGENPVKTLRPLRLVDEGGGNWNLEVSGDGFLYRMVRCLMGTLARVGAGKLPPGRIPELLGEARRTPEVHTAPPQGLFLEEVHYPRFADDGRDAGSGTAGP